MKERFDIRDPQHWGRPPHFPGQRQSPPPPYLHQQPNSSSSRQSISLANYFIPENAFHNAAATINNDGCSHLWLHDQSRRTRGPTPPPPYSQHVRAPSEMPARSYTARVSSLSHHNVPQFRSLDRRKEDLEEGGHLDDCASDEADEIKNKYNHDSDSFGSHIPEASFPSPKGPTTLVAYPFPDDRPGGSNRPLISFVRNDWRHRDPRHSRSPSPPEDDICPAGWSEILCSRAFKRWMVVYIVLMIAVWIWWFGYYGPKYVEDSFVRDSLSARLKSKNGHFGMNRGVSFTGLRPLQQLDRKLVPGSEVEGAKKRRLIIVGDIHGCVEELNSLLDHTKFDASRDHLITTGDCIAKGPDSAAVLDLLLLHNASSVRGNHEDRILHAYRDHRAPSHQKFVSSSNPSSAPGPITLKHGATDDLELAASLTDDQVEYLGRWPLILSLGPVLGMGNVSVVHAGLTPGVPLLRQDPLSAMNMRSMDLRNHIPSPRHAPVLGVDKKRLEDYDGNSRLAIKPWTVLWDAWQEMQPKSARETVIYGHDAKKGVVQGPWSMGLDGGCVLGGKLAALVIEEVGRRDVRKEVVTVPCKNYTAQKVLRPLGEN